MCVIHARRSEQRAAAVAAELRGLGVESTVLLADLADPQAAEQLVERAWEWRSGFGYLDQQRRRRHADRRRRALDLLAKARRAVAGRRARHHDLLSRGRRQNEARPAGASS